MGQEGRCAGELGSRPQKQTGRQAGSADGWHLAQQPVRYWAGRPGRDCPTFLETSSFNSPVRAAPRARVPAGQPARHTAVAHLDSSKLKSCCAHPSSGCAARQGISPWLSPASRAQASRAAAGGWAAAGGPAGGTCAWRGFVSRKCEEEQHQHEAWGGPEVAVAGEARAVSEHGRGQQQQRRNRAALAAVRIPGSRGSRIVPYL